MERSKGRPGELRDEKEGRIDGQRKDIDFHLKEAISASEELWGQASARVCLCAFYCGTLHAIRLETLVHTTRT